MTTTPRLVAVGLDALEALAAAIAEQLLQVRRVHLKNRAPRARRLHQLRRDVACGRAKPWHMLLALSFTDLEDGAPLSAVVRPYQSAIAALEERARRISRTPAGTPSPVGFMRRETRAQAKLDDAQWTAREHPDSPEALEALDRAWTEYLAESTPMIAWARARRAELLMGGSLPAAVVH